MLPKQQSTSKFSSNALEKAVNTSVATTQLKLHPYQIDSICFHPQCQADRCQLTHIMSDQIQQPHRNHQSDIYPIYKTSPGFRILSKIHDAQLASQISKQKSDIIEEAYAFKTRTVRMIDDFIRKIQRKLSCYQVFTQQRSLLKLSQKLKGEGEKHYACCIPIINKLKQINYKCQRNQSDIKGYFQSFVRTQISKEFINIKTLQKNIQCIINQKDKQSDVVYSEINNGDEAYNMPQEKYRKSVHQLIQTSSTPSLQNILKKHNDLECQDDANQLQTQKIITPKQQGEQPMVISLQNTNLDQSQQLLPDIKREVQHMISTHKYKEQAPFGVDIVDENTIALWKKMQLTELKGVVVFIEQNRAFKSLMFQANILKNRYFTQFIDIQKFKLQHMYFSSFYARNITDKKLEVLQQIKSNGVQISIRNSLRCIKRWDISQFFPKYYQKSTKNNFVIKNYQQIEQQLKSQRSYDYFQKSQIFDCDHSKIQILCIHSKLRNSQKLHSFMKKLKNLRIIGFKNTYYANCVLNLAKNLENKKQLHTISVIDGKTRFSNFFQEIKVLCPNQLKQIHFSALGIDCSNILPSNVFQQISYHRNLETLIMTNFNLHKHSNCRNEDKTKTNKLKEFCQLSKLVHLNLYGCKPIFSDFVDYIHPDCRKTLKMLNLGCTYIDNRVAKTLSKFTNIESLNIDYTEIDSKGLLKITENMANLKNLSIQNLNGLPIEQNHGTNIKKLFYGKIVPQCFQNMNHKSLTYANIHKCDFLMNYDWKGFSSLKVIRANLNVFKNEICIQLKSKGIHIVSLQPQILVKRDPCEQTNHYNNDIEKNLSVSIQSRGHQQEKD